MTVKPWVDKRTAWICSNVVYCKEDESVGRGIKAPDEQDCCLPLLTKNSDEVRNAQERNDDKESFSSFPVLMISMLPLPTRPQLGHHNIEDGDQDESICSQQEQYRPYVDPLKAGTLKERTFSFENLKCQNS